MDIALHLSMSVWPSPCPLVVKEEHQVEPLTGLLLPLLPEMEDVFGWDRDGHPIVQQALLWHLWVNDLEWTHSQSNRQFRSVYSTAHSCSISWTVLWWKLVTVFKRLHHLLTAHIWWYFSNIRWNKGLPEQDRRDIPDTWPTPVLEAPAPSHPQTFGCSFLQNSSRQWHHFKKEMNMCYIL